MPTPSRRSTRSRRFPAPNLTRRRLSPLRLHESLDHWGGSLAFCLLGLLCLGYASARLIPQPGMSYALALAGGLSFLLGALFGGGKSQLPLQRLRSWTLRLGLSALLLLGARWHYQGAEEALLTPFAPQAPAVTARITDLHGLDAGLVDYELQTLSPEHRLLRLRHKALPTAQIGDTLCIQGARWQDLPTLLQERPAWGASLYAGGYSAVGRGGEVTLATSPTSTLLSQPLLLARRLRGRLLDRLALVPLAPKTRLLLGALTLGSLPRSDQGREMRQVFVEGGVAHLLAVSGFHLGVLVALLAGLCRRLPYLQTHEWAQWLVLLIGTWLFTALTGASIPTLRAAGMLTLYLGARYLQRLPSFAEVLAWPALVQLILHPTSLWGASLLLTYGAIFGIRLFFRPLRGALGKLPSRWSSYLWDTLAMMLAVLPFVLPLSLYLFGWLSLAFPWTSLLALPLASLLIPLGGLCFLLLAVGITPPKLFLALLDQLASWLEGSIRLLEGIDLLQVHYRPSLVVLLVYFVLLIGLLVLARGYARPKR